MRAGVLQHVVRLSAIVASMMWPSWGEAQSLLGQDYDVEVTNGPVLDSGRIVAMSGAYVALSEGIDGAAFNPASYGVRTVNDTSWFDFEPTASLSFNFGNDLFNRGRSARDSDLVGLGLGARMLFGDVGVGALERLFVHSTLTPTGEIVDVVRNDSFFGLALPAFHDGLTIGLGGRALALSMAYDDVGDEISYRGVGLEVGAIWGPIDARYRIGGTIRSPITAVPRGLEAKLANSATRWLPKHVISPWELELGTAVQFGTRQMNFELPHRRTRKESSHAAPRAPGDATGVTKATQDAGTSEENENVEAVHDAPTAEADPETTRGKHLMLVASLVITGPTPNSIGVPGLLEQTPMRAGRRHTVGFRSGFEAEPWINRLKVRVGTYFEPSRFSVSYRTHITGGTDLRLFEWDLFGLVAPFSFQASANFDLARDYRSLGFTVGFWS